jgi:hypothetical protein
MLARIWQGILCAIVGFVIGFGEYVLGGIQWYSGVHSGHVHSSYFLYYTLIALQFVLPIWILFLILYIGFANRLLTRWSLSLGLGLVIGAGTTVALLYGVFYPEHKAIWGPVGGPAMAARYYPFFPFLGRTMLASVSMFLLGTVIARHHQHLTKRCSQPLADA